MKTFTKRGDRMQRGRRRRMFHVESAESSSGQLAPSSNSYQLIPSNIAQDFSFCFSFFFFTQWIWSKSYKINRFLSLWMATSASELWRFDWEEADQEEADWEEDMKVKLLALNLFRHFPVRNHGAGGLYVTA